MRIARNWNRMFDQLVNGPRPVRSSLGAIVASNGESIHRHAPVPVPARIERREPIAASDDSNSSFRDHVPVLANMEERDLFPHDGNGIEPAHTSRRAPRTKPETRPGRYNLDFGWSGHRSSKNHGRKPRTKDHRA